MHFALTEEQQMIVDTTRAFVENELYPHEAEVERTGHLRMELVREIQAKGIFSTGAQVFYTQVQVPGGDVVVRSR